jgi:xanthine dehydrogenase YagR molybdenum-binding subunit
MSPVLGSPLDRVDGRAKVTGAATFAADQRPPDLTYAALVTSTIARGRILGMDLAAASSAPGVVLIVTADNAPEITPPATPPWPFG